jgi:hypothetical protein
MLMLIRLEVEAEDVAIDDRGTHGSRPTLQGAHAGMRGGRREADPSSQLEVRRPAVGLELAKDRAIDVIE